MQDNAHPHVVRIVTEYLDTVGIRRLPWPAHSPDLNLIEHIWDNLKRRIRSRTSLPTTIRELEDAVLMELNNIPQCYIKNIIDSIPNRLQKDIKARGGNTRY